MFTQIFSFIYKHTNMNMVRLSSIHSVYYKYVNMVRLSTIHSVFYKYVNMVFAHFPQLYALTVNIALKL